MFILLCFAMDLKRNRENDFMYACGWWFYIAYVYAKIFVYTVHAVTELVYICCFLLFSFLFLLVESKWFCWSWTKLRNFVILLWVEFISLLKSHYYCADIINLLKKEKNTTKNRFFSFVFWKHVVAVCIVSNEFLY